MGGGGDRSVKLTRELLCSNPSHIYLVGQGWIHLFVIPAAISGIDIIILNLITYVDLPTYNHLQKAFSLSLCVHWCANMYSCSCLSYHAFSQVY
jgi:hypothetical protein